MSSQPAARQPGADNQELAREIGGRIRRLRLAAKLSQSHIARRCAGWPSSAGRP